jgi:hypothetical protein
VAASEEMAHLVRLQWRSELRAVAGVREASSLRALLGDRERELAALQDQHSQTKGALAQAQAVQAEAEAALAYLRNTRRYRLASRLAAPLDSLRAAFVTGSSRLWRRAATQPLAHETRAVTAGVPRNLEVVRMPVAVEAPSRGAALAPARRTRRPWAKRTGA